MVFTPPPPKKKNSARYFADSLTDNDHEENVIRDEEEHTAMEKKKYLHLKWYFAYFNLIRRKVLNFIFSKNTFLYHAKIATITWIKTIITNYNVQNMKICHGTNSQNMALLHKCF
jgi:hypothetical protein